MEYFRQLFDHLAWIEHQFLSGIRDSRKVGMMRGMMRGVGGVRKSIHHSWLAKGLGLGLLCWGFKGVQEEIPSEEDSTLQIGSVAFPPGQYTSPQIHPCHRLFDQDGHQDSSSASPLVKTLLPVNFCYSRSLEAVVMRQLRRWKAMTKVIDTLTQEDFDGTFQKLFECYNKCIAAEGDYFEGDSSFMCVLSIKVPIQKKIWKFIVCTSYDLILERENGIKISLRFWLVATKHYEFGESICGWNLPLKRNKHFSSKRKKMILSLCYYVYKTMLIYFRKSLLRYISTLA